MAVPLPVELIREIILNVSRMRTFATLPTLAALALVSKTFHNLAIPILYRTVYLDNEHDALSFIHCIGTAHASSGDNAKYVVRLFIEPDTISDSCFEDVMSLPGLNPQTLFFEICWRIYNANQVASTWEVRPKGIVVMKYSHLSHKNSWLSQHMALFSQLTHLFLEESLNDDKLSFCLELRTLTHICLPIWRGLDSKDALRQIHLLLGMPLMEVVLIYPVLSDDDDVHPGPEEKKQLNGMGFPKGDLFPLLADSIPDERLYMCPETDMFRWYQEGITPWDLGIRCLTMPWRKAVKVA